MILGVLMDISPRMDDQLPGAKDIKSDVLNTFHQDNFKVAFSNFPIINDFKNLVGMDQPVDMRIFDYNVKNITIPTQSLETTEISFLNRVQLQPISRGNDNLQSVTVEFKVDNTFLNYFLIYTYIRQMRCGLIKLDRPYYKNVIHEMFVDGFTNLGVHTVRLKFINLIPISTGSLILESGASGDLTFAVSFNYEEFQVEILGAKDRNG